MAQKGDVVYRGGVPYGILLDTEEVCVRGEVLNMGEENKVEEAVQELKYDTGFARFTKVVVKWTIGGILCMISAGLVLGVAKGVLWLLTR